MGYWGFYKKSAKFYWGVHLRLAKIFERISFILGANEISAKATIANSAFFHRGLGCVVHDNAVIGEHCTISQNVTIESK